MGRSGRRFFRPLLYDTIRLEGALFAADLLETICLGGAPFQSKDDYQTPKGLQLASEYGRAFHIAKAQWSDFFSSLEKQKGLDCRALTLSFTISFLRDVLGYVNARPLADGDESTSLAGRRYPLSMMIDGRLPVIVASPKTGLDESSREFGVEGGGKKKTPFQLGQEYLNASKTALWGIAFNGKVIRLLRNSNSLTRPRFLEFDLERIIKEERYADFKALWFILHHSRAGLNAEGDSIWERWRLRGLEEGSRVRERLREGVGQALLILGNGFLSHERNQGLRDVLKRGERTARDFYTELLRLIYRMLFVITLEERELLHDKTAARGAIDVYSSGYSFKRLRERSMRSSESTRHSDLWIAMTLVFRALAVGEPRLALPALGGLFSSDQCPSLDASLISNKALLLAMRNLRWAEVNSVLSPIDYRNMGSEELGSVYESLLEYEPRIEMNDASGRKFQLPGFGSERAAAGNERRTTGSYYTPESLVNELIQSALDPVIERVVWENASDPVKALLEMSVVDPSCGSGHFLLAAARRIAERVAGLRSQDFDGAVKPEMYRSALRDVVAHCIYGVDLNPLAVELARFALWLEAHEPGRSLAFVDNHVKCGNSLLGLLRPEQMEQGIPQEAYTALSGDEKNACSQLKEQNKAVLKRIAESSRGQKIWFDRRQWPDWFALDSKVNAMPDGNLDEVTRKKHEYEAARSAKRNSPLARAADVYVGAFLAAKKDGAEHSVPTSDTLTEVLGGDVGEVGSDAPVEAARAACADSRIFHWFLEFPEVMESDAGGFDCVLGNPPWERIKLQEEEFFASRHPHVAGARNKAERAKYINLLGQGLLYVTLEGLPPESCEPSDSERQLHAEFLSARRFAEASSLYCRVKGESGRHPLSGRGDVNTYALFAETMSQLLAPHGRAGFIVPTGIATDDSTKEFFADLVQKGRLVSLYDFENRDAIFPGVHRSYKFCLLTVGAAEAADFAFFLTDARQLAETERRFTLRGGDFTALNPNTRTCPVFRSRMDAELTRKIYARVPVLIREAAKNEPESNPWRIKFFTLFHMSNDSRLFKSSGGSGLLPLYEAKMIHQFDHRWASYGASGGSGCDELPERVKGDSDLSATPRYWVDESEVLSRLARVVGLSPALQDLDLLRARCPRWLMGWRDICRATDERTVIASVLPRAGVGHKMPLFLIKDQSSVLSAAFLSNMNTITFDYIARQKIGGISLTYFYLKQFPVLPPESYTPSDLKFIAPRVLELTYTSHDMKPWAEDICPEYSGGPFAFDPDRRAVLRAELDAYYAKLYGLSRDELRYILDPADAMGADYPSETFRVLKDKEIARYGEYRTRRLVLEAWERLGH